MSNKGRASHAPLEVQPEPSAEQDSTDLALESNGYGRSTVG